MVADEAPFPSLGDDTEDTVRRLCPINGYGTMKPGATSGHLFFLMGGNICLKQNWKDAILFYISSFLSQDTDSLLSGASGKPRLTC